MNDSIAFVQKTAVWWHATHTHTYTHTHTHTQEAEPSEPSEPSDSESPKSPQSPGRDQETNGKGKEKPEPEPEPEPEEELKWTDIGGRWCTNDTWFVKTGALRIKTVRHTRTSCPFPPRSRVRARAHMNIKCMNTRVHTHRQVLSDQMPQTLVLAVGGLSSKTGVVQKQGPCTT